MKSNYKTNNYNVSKLRIVDLFAGVGGLSYPFVDLNKQNEIVFCSELSPESQKTYIELHGHNNVMHGDITKIPPSSIPDHDLLLGGFPCQAFSIAGHRKGFEDDKGRGNLFFNIVNILKEKKPTYFLLENVKNLQGHDSGRTYQTICSYLTQLGYGIKSKVLNAKYFGLLQNRERIFIFGKLNSWHGECIPMPDGDTGIGVNSLNKMLEQQSLLNFSFPKAMDTIRPLTTFKNSTITTQINVDGDVAAYMDPPKELNTYFQSYSARNDWSDFIYNNKLGHFKKAVDYINESSSDNLFMGPEQWPNDGSYQYIYQWRRKYARINKGGLCPTLTANMGTGGHNVPLLVCGKMGSDKLIRKLTPEECFAFQGFDEKFIRKLSKVDITNGHKYKQAGNSVPVTVIKKIAEQFLKTELIDNNVKNIIQK